MYLCVGGGGVCVCLHVRFYVVCVCVCVGGGVGRWAGMHLHAFLCVGVYVCAVFLGHIFRGFAQISFDPTKYLLFYSIYKAIEEVCSA